MNGRFHPTATEPLRMYVADFDKNEQVEQLLTYSLGGKEVPFATHAEVIKQMPGLRNDVVGGAGVELGDRDHSRLQRVDVPGHD